ncbi:hypothetical protein [Chloroflexus sp.]|uniref:hypothetical protein n=1 Tax=Chloroflexus sp. TaxID=1904827 RepID=UPI002ACE3711|nr:hypothetical protein [Chloroflexus sp.]
MSAYGVSLENLDLPPEILSDPTIGWLIQNADPELWAPRHYLIVDEKCKGDHHLIATWFAIYRLLIFYKPIGKRAFGQREIAAVGRVGRGHLSGKHGTIRKLAALGLIIIDGYEDGDEGKPIFRIDTARLEAESILLTRKRLAAGQLVPRRKPASLQQLDMFRMLGLTPDEELLTLARQEHQADEYLQVPDMASIGATAGSYERELAPIGATFEGDKRQLGLDVASIGARSGATWHQSEPAAAPMGAAATVNKHQLEPGVAPIGATASPSEAIWHPSVPPLHPNEAAWLSPGPHDALEAAPAESTPAPTGAFGWMDHGHEGRREGAAPSAATLSPDSLRLMVQQAMNHHLPVLIAATIQQITSGAGVGTGTALAGAAKTTLTDDIPPRPNRDEPELHRGLLTTWQLVSRQKEIPARDLAQLEVLVSRYDGPTGGHAAYWLCRVMWEADRSNDGNEPIRLRLIGGYMRRMEQDCEFSTASLEKKETKKEAGVPKREAAPSPAASSASSNGLPAALADHWVITAWRSYAGVDAVILVERAQHLVATVSRRDVWEAVLANWSDKYKRKANWTNFDGLLDWYSREAAKPVAVTADEFDPDGPPPSASVIDNHPGLDSTERADWYRRFHAAGDNKAAKQAVIKRLLAERPIKLTD